KPIRELSARAPRRLPFTQRTTKGCRTVQLACVLSSGAAVGLTAKEAPGFLIGGSSPAASLRSQRTPFAGCRFQRLRRTPAMTLEEPNRASRSPLLEKL